MTDKVESKKFFGLYPNRPYFHVLELNESGSTNKTLWPLIGTNHLEVEYHGKVGPFHEYENRMVFTPRFPINQIPSLEEYKQWVDKTDPEMVWELRHIAMVHSAVPLVPPLARMVNRTTDKFREDNPDYAKKEIQKFEAMYNKQNSKDSRESSLLWAYDGNRSKVHLGVVDLPEYTLAAAGNIAALDRGIPESADENHPKVRLCRGHLEAMIDKTFGRTLLRRAVDVRYIAFHPFSKELGNISPDIYVAREILVTEPAKMDDMQVITPVLLELKGSVKSTESAKDLVDTGLEREKEKAKKPLFSIIKSDFSVKQALWMYASFLVYWPEIVPEENEEPEELVKETP
jgi:hypothetical protein